MNLDRTCTILLLLFSAMTAAATAPAACVPTSNPNRYAAVGSTLRSDVTDALLDAIMQVESGGKDDAVGDNGKAIGAFQIHRVYWQDAVEHDPSIGGRYEDCFDRDYAKRIVIAYMDRYAPKGASDEVLARIHNGGPRGHKKSATVKYWHKVRKELK